MSLNPFMRLGPSFLVAANTTAPAGVQVQCCGNQNTNVFRLFNDSNQTVYYGYANTAQGAKDASVIPVAAGNLSMGIPSLTVQVIRTGISTPQVFFSGITANATQANLTVTPGEGF